MAALVVHGGAKTHRQELWPRCLQGVKAAARRGYQVMSEGGTAVDAAEAAVVVLEDCPALNAGTGSALTLEGHVEEDAFIMEGSGLRAGAVGAVRNLPNPVKVARLVMDATPHVLLVGEGANKFAAERGIPQVAPEQLVTAEAQKDLATFRQYNRTVSTTFNKAKPSDHTTATNAAGGEGERQESVATTSQEPYDTVGCAVVDVRGRTACATSTGGITAKMPGRVGDTPMIGGGGYAMDEVGAVSTTGHGEAIARVCLAHRVTSLMTAGKTVQEAVQESLSYMEARAGGYGGMVAVSAGGQVGLHFTTSHMPWAFVSADTLHYGMHHEQHFTEPL